ncbi:hypothetical protein CCACVL1_23543 [Corchorus capsularis]|uniref:Uncharacterized protein n=1 Tax=Corchorus capsularis TaxID=210143 RepID=A0A1R3GTG5_COCAP|nr:hypothetical protein CCACVL1_23543 [Corchorus capsularis]
MEEYLQYMKTLRSQINDVEDQAANTSAQEQIHLSTIQTMQNDLLSAKSETKQLGEDTEKMLRVKGQICSQIIAKQRKIASLESDSSTLTQTLELIQQENMSLGSKLTEKRTGSNLGKSTEKSKSMVWYFATSSMLFFDKTNTELIVIMLFEMLMIRDLQVKNNHDEQMTESEGTFSVENHLIKEHENNEAVNDLIVKLDSAKAKLDGIAQRKAKFVTDNGKIKVSIEQAKHRTSNFKPELLALSIMTLEEEYKALLSDKDGETEYLCSMQYKI